MHVAVLGAGSWGTALALVLSENKNISLTIYHHRFIRFHEIKIPRAKLTCASIIHDI